MQRRVTSDAELKQWHEKVVAQAEAILSEPPSKYEIPDGLRLLSTSRRVLQRIQTLGLVYRLGGDRKYLERAWNELEAAAKFQDWNPRHFLDTAEMTHAFAIAYDWMFDAWTPEQRKVIREAMMEKGLVPALGVHRGTARTGKWNLSQHNWNQVCNGGITIGALAIADEEPALAGELLASGLKSVQLAMRHFAPDGAWAEGPGYWNYATIYNVAMLAALDTALGTDFGLAQIPGFAECGTFPIYITGPLRRTFNYADGSDGTIRAPHMFWLAQKFSRPEYASYQRAVASPHPLDLLWSAPARSDALPPDKYFRDAEVVTMRSGWDRQALFVGFKAGDNKANHSNLDLGTFVLDALGERWFLDLGADNYNLPGFFGNQRWTYYRMRAEGHNTLVLNPGPEPDQNVRAAAKILRYESKPARVFAIADLTAGYKPHAVSVQRGVAMLDRNAVLVQDELQCGKPAEVWSFFHTPAEIKLGDKASEATLTIGGNRLSAKILSPAGAVFTVLPAAPLPGLPNPEKQNANRGIRKLAVHLRDCPEARIAVLFQPMSGPGPEIKRFDLTPLSAW